MWGSFRQDAVESSYRQRRVADSAATEHAAQVRRRSEEIEDRLERLVLLTEAMWELLAERLGVTVDDLAAKIVEIDGRSGAIDGSRQPSAARRCPSCDAAVTAEVRLCQFCGAHVPGQDPFAV